MSETTAEKHVTGRRRFFVQVCGAVAASGLASGAGDEAPDTSPQVGMPTIKLGKHRITLTGKGLALVLDQVHAIGAGSITLSGKQPTFSRAVGIWSDELLPSSTCTQEALVSGSGYYLVDDNGNYIVDDNGNYIVIGGLDPWTDEVLSSSTWTCESP